MALSSTAVDYIRHDSDSRIGGSSQSIALKTFKDAFAQEKTGETSQEVVEVEAAPSLASDEFKLPSKRSLFIVIFGNVLFQITFFIIVSSASHYAEYLGGSATFSGLTIGIPTVFSGLTLLVTTRLDKGRYNGCFQFAYGAVIVGSILYGLAYRANYLYLILIGRCVIGLGFICFMYHKRYCSDPRIVGVRRRTTLASWLVVGQGMGFSAGPFFGGILYKIGFPNPVFNGYTSPGWVMAVVWVFFWGLSNALFQDIPKDSPALNAQTSDVTWRDLSWRQWGVTVCMCYFAMTCFLILGAWEANIPVYTAISLGYTPFNAGNFIALGGIMTLPFLLLNVRYARRFQDRTTLATGTTLGMIGLVLKLILLNTSEGGKIPFGPFLVCWFLIALGFNLASTCTLSLLSKQLPDQWCSAVSVAIQYSNYSGRVSGAVLGGAGYKIGMQNYLGIQIAIVGFGGLMYSILWRDLKAKTG